MKQEDEISIINQIDQIGDLIGHYEAFFTVEYESLKEPRSEKHSPGRSAYLTRQGLEILYKLFYIIKAEMNFQYIIYLCEKDVTTRVNEVLFNYFWNTAAKGEDLEKTIIENIKKLEERKFLTCDLNNNFLEIELEDIIPMIREIREKRIEFYEAILKEYLRNKEKYNESLGLSKSE